MKKIAQGSVLLTFFLILSSLCLLSCVVWRTATLTFDVALNKQEYEKYYYFAAAYLRYGADLCKDNFENVQQYLKLNRVLHAQAVVAGTDNFMGSLQIKSLSDDLLSLCVKLKYQERDVCAVSCSLKRSKISSATHPSLQDYFEVSSWKHGVVGLGCY